MDGVSVLVLGLVGIAELLDVAAPRLADARTRVLRVHPPYSLPDFMDQVSPGSRSLGDAGLAQGFRTLTVPDAPCERIALLVEDAHLMPQATLRYIELALRAGPNLHVAFTGHSEFANTLALHGFDELRKRLRLRLFLTGLPAAPPSPPPRSFGARHQFALKSAAIAAGLAVIVWRHYPSTAPFAGLAATGPNLAPWSSHAPPAPPSLPPPAEDSEPAAEAMPATAEPPVDTFAEPALPASSVSDSATEPTTPPAPPAAINAPTVPEAEARTPLPTTDLALSAPPPVSPAATGAPTVPEAKTPTPPPAADPAMEPISPPAPPAATEAPTLSEAASLTPPSAAGLAVEQAVGPISPSAPPAATEAPTVPEAASLTPPSAADPAVEQAPPPAATEAPPVLEAAAPTPPAVIATAPAAAPDPKPRSPTAPHIRPRPLPAHPERLAAQPPPVSQPPPVKQPSPTKQNEQRCRDIALHAQLGENITNADQTFLRNGCR